MMKRKVYFATPVNGRTERTFEEKKLAALKRCIEVRQILTREQPDWMVTFSFTVCPINEHIDEPTAMARCYDLLRKCDMIVLDRGWLMSEGCRKEKRFAHQHGKYVVKLNDILKESYNRKPKVKLK
jgi:hypothetical protein